MMKFNEMATPAFWISPQGRVQYLSGSDNHIGLVIENPHVFGYTSEQIAKIYDKHNEEIGSEGKAREEIILDLVKKGWMRIRKYNRPDYWSVNVSNLGNRIKDALQGWANRMIANGEGKYSDVKIDAPNYNQRFSLSDLAADVLYMSEGLKVPKERFKLIFEEKGIMKEGRYQKVFKNTVIRQLEIKSFTEGLKLNTPFKLPENRVFYTVDGKKLLESVSFEFENKGGIVVFSTEVNAIINTSTFLKKIKGYFAGKFKSFKNQIMRYSKINDVVKDFEDITAYSIGNFFKGRYFDRKTNKTFDEKSMSVEIIGITSDILVDVAESICKEFYQKEVLVKDYQTGKIFLVDTN